MVRTKGDVAAVSSRQRMLAGLLRTAWTDSKLTQRALGEKLGVSHTTLSRWFDGSVAVDSERVSALLAVLDVVGEKRENILRMARGENADQQAWVTSGPTGVSDQLEGTMEIEKNAAEMIDWSPLIVPGLLQTRDYARAIISSNEDLRAADVDRLVTLRLGRQNAILRDDPLQLTAFIGIPAVHGNIGDDGVMIGQLRHLLKVASFDAVTVQLLRVDGGWHGGLLGAFAVYNFKDPMPSIVSLEHHRTGSFVDDAIDVAAYKKLATDLDQRALTPAESRDVIAQEIASRETS